MHREIICLGFRFSESQTLQDQCFPRSLQQIWEQQEWGVSSFFSIALSILNAENHSNHWEDSLGRLLSGLVEAHPT